ncbi:YchJ family protein [Candidatus Entotheonella palauensis]|uniref:UPF0225 protein ETSY2_43950 n=1 Tax=Candidatus Entotheonella gemina TaxID=1429439 RepID=W4LKB9_9BACT|nr:YchJ family protein [Candidatus Entotheonella palauensis]ETW97776.1 MAG: hypothetical protein ETSY2_43950 [Candidatus Entotheonella gemina]
MTAPMMPTPCPCDSGPDYRACCGRFISGREQPDSAEALMRSRYTAYTQANAEYLMATWHPSQHDGLTADSLRESARALDWQRLEVLHSAGAGQAREGVVEFKAWYRKDGQLSALHERSRFVREGLQWFYVDGQLNPPAQYQKIGRNAPCPCGSGKKYKKCCGV